MSFCKKVKPTIKKITGIIDDVLTGALEVAHEVTTSVSKIMADPTAEFLIDMIPPGTDKDKVLATIEKVLTETDLVYQCQDLQGVQKITCMIKALGLLDKTKKSNVLLNLNAAITKELDGGRYRQSVYDTMAQGKHIDSIIKAGGSLFANA